MTASPMVPRAEATGSGHQPILGLAASEEIQTMTTTTTYPHTCIQGPLCADAEHPCPKEAFLDDPITREYGVGEMVDRITCVVCARLDGQLCEHDSCLAITYAPCTACEYEGMYGQGEEVER